MACELDGGIPARTDDLLFTPFMRQMVPQIPPNAFIRGDTPGAEGAWALEATPATLMTMTAPIGSP